MKRKWIILASAAVVIAFAFWLRDAPPEPDHQGKPLSTWMDQLLENYPAIDQPAAEALGAMGEPAVKRLIWMVQDEENSLERRLIALSGRFPWVTRFIFSTSYWDRHAAIVSLREIGPAASNAIPVLERISAGEDHIGKAIADSALVIIRNESLEPWIAAYQDRSGTNYIRGQSMLMSLGPRAKQAIPVLLEDLQSTNASIRLMSVAVLGSVGIGSEAGLEALTNATHDPDAAVRSVAISRLCDFKAMAAPAAEVVLPLLRDPDPDVRRSALFFAWRVAEPADLAPFLSEIQQASRNSDSFVAETADRVLLKMQSN